MDTAQNYQLTKIRDLLGQKILPAGLTDDFNQELERLEKLITTSGYLLEYDREIKRLNFILSLPFNKSSQDILDLARASQVLNKNHYGLQKVKERILEYLSILILNSRLNSNAKPSVLAFVGLVGSGKTSLAYSIAESLGRQMIRIPFGGLGSVKELRGESHFSLEAEPGHLMKAVAKAGVNNPVVLLDEIDRVAIESRSDVMGVLVELLDPEQNFAFTDHYIDYPFDLSKILFIATANNTNNIATAVLDRLEIIEMPSYSDEEKIMIAKKYLLPKAVLESGLSANILTIDDNVWPEIVRPLGYDGGIRSLERHIRTVVRRVAKEVVEGGKGPYLIKSDNIGRYLN